MKLRLKALALMTGLVTQLLMLLTPSIVRAVADTCTWTGAVNGSWSNGGNWSGCDNGGVPENGDTLVIAVAGTSSNDISSLSVVSITFGATHTVNGNALTVTSGLSSNAGTQTINTNISLGGAQTFSTTGTGSLVINGNVNLSGNNLIVDADGENIDIVGVISGAGDITNTGSNTLDLRGVNTFTGVFTINAGQVRIYSSSALGSSATNTVINAGGTINLSASGLTVPEDFTVTGSGNVGGGAIRNGLGSNTLSGDISLTGSTMIQSDTSQTLTINGVIDGAGGSTLDLRGRIILNGTNTYTGSTNITNGFSPGSELFVNGSIVSTLTGSGGILGGTGSIGQATLNTGFTPLIVDPGTNGTIGTLSTGNLSFGAGGQDVRIDMNGSLTDQISVTGSVDLNNADLLVQIIGEPVKDTPLTILANDGVDPVTGTFNGLAEGATFSVNSRTYTISYVGGSGNDVTLTAEPKTTSLSLASSSASIVQGTSVTFTASVSVGTPTPTGNVNFYDGATLIGTSALNGSGVATLTLTNLVVGNRTITAQYQGNSIYDSATSSALSQSVTAVAGELVNTGQSPLYALIAGLSLALIAVWIDSKKSKSPSA